MRNLIMVKDHLYKKYHNYNKNHNSHKLLANNVFTNILTVFYQHKLTYLLLAYCIISGLFSPKLAIAQNIPLPSDAPLEIELLNQKGKDRQNIMTSKNIDKRKLTIPSLWWVKENSEKKLLSDWLVYPASKQENARVDILVNYQVWSLLDYLEKYSFVNRLGSVASKFKYNIRVFNYQQEPLATYTCHFIQSPPLCKIKINTQNKISPF